MSNNDKVDTGVRNVDDLRKQSLAQSISYDEGKIDKEDIKEKS